MTLTIIILLGFISLFVFSLLPPTSPLPTDQAILATAAISQVIYNQIFIKLDLTLLMAYL